MTCLAHSYFPPARSTSSRIVFSEIEEDSFHWEMFLSSDGGATFTHTDVRESTRLAPSGR